jgi:hypothetical protein
MPRNNTVRSVDLLRVACTAVLDRRTVRRYLAGLPVTNSSAARNERALRELGLEVARPAAPESTT